MNKMVIVFNFVIILHNHYYEFINMMIYIKINYLIKIIIYKLLIIKNNIYKILIIYKNHNYNIKNL